jgi:hypothetical protein
MLVRALLLALAVVGLAGCQVVKGSGVKASEFRKVGKFSKVEVQGATDVHIKIASGRELKITADDNLLKQVETVVEGDKLIIRTKGSWSSHIGINVFITNPDLKSVSIAGSGDIDVATVRESDFSASIAGSGDIKVRGMATNVKASISGSGDIDLSEVQATRGKASIAGSGDIRLNVSSELTASIAGSGDITYSGNPRVTKSVAGSGDVRRR